MWTIPALIIDVLISNLGWTSTGLKFFTQPQLGRTRLAGGVCIRRPRQGGAWHGLAGIDWRVWSCQDLLPWTHRLHCWTTLDHSRWTHTHTLATILTTSTDHGSNLMQAPSLSLIKFLNLIIFQPCFIVITMNAIHVQEQNHSSNCRRLYNWSNLHLHSVLKSSYNKKNPLIHIGRSLMFIYG